MLKAGALFSTSNRKHTLAGICRKTTRFTTPYTSSVLPSWGYSLLSSPCLSLHWEVHSGSTSGAQAAQGAAKRLYIHMHSCRQSRVLATKRHRIFSQTHVQKSHIVRPFFCRYVLDFILVYVTLFAELVLQSQAAGMLVFLRSWRLVRQMHQLTPICTAHTPCVIAQCAAH